MISGLASAVTFQIEEEDQTDDDGIDTGEDFDPVS